MESADLHPVSRKWTFEDEFIIVGVRGDRAAALRELHSQWPDIEVFAPTERKMVRTRRKSKKASKPDHYWIERPIFMEYVAITALPDWEQLFKFEWLVFVLDNGALPVRVSRRELGGMARSSDTRSWEGCLVEIVSGPMAGKTGVYRKGKVDLSLFGRRVNVSVEENNITPCEIGD